MTPTVASLDWCAKFREGVESEGKREGEEREKFGTLLYILSIKNSGLILRANLRGSIEVFPNN